MPWGRWARAARPAVHGRGSKRGRSAGGRAARPRAALELGAQAGGGDADAPGRVGRAALARARGAGPQARALARQGRGGARRGAEGARERHRRRRGGGGGGRERRGGGAIDATQITTARDGKVWLFGVAEHWNAELVGWHVTKHGTRHEALQAMSMAVSEQFGTSAATPPEVSPCGTTTAAPSCPRTSSAR